MHFEKLDGILCILNKNPIWPNPANLFIIPHESGFSMIDVGCGGPAGADRLLDGLRHWGLDLQQLRTVILSHAHPDHMGALGWLLDAVQPRVGIHERDMDSARDPRRLIRSFDIPLSERRMASGGRSDQTGGFDLLGYFERAGCAMTSAARVERLVEGQSIRLGDFMFRVLHTPGHSPGHISLFEENRGILFSGDVLGAVPAWYTPSSGGLIGYLESLERLERLPARLVLPSHGEPMEDPGGAIDFIRHRLLKRESTILGLLESRSPRTFHELNEALFQHPFLAFFPGCGITESHLLKLQRDGVIRRVGESIALED